MMRNRTIIIIAAVIIAVILIGEAFIYTSDQKSNYSIDISKDDGNISYSLHSNIANTYGILLIDNGDSVPFTDCYFYYDHGYATPIEKQYIDYYEEQLTYILKKSDIGMNVLSAAELSDNLKKDIDSDKCNKLLISVTGSLPDTIYKGNSSDMIFQWLDKGGSLYWAGNPIGENYSTTEGNNYITGGQSLFLGSECLNTSVSKAHTVITENRFCEALCLQNNDVRYGVDMTKISGREYISLGYSEDYCSSITLIEYGKGTIGIFGGYLSNLQRMDMAQVISAHMTHSSELIEFKTGDISKQTVEGQFSLLISDHRYSVYAYFGGYFMEYGRYTGY